MNYRMPMDAPSFDVCWRGLSDNTKVLNSIIGIKTGDDLTILEWDAAMCSYTGRYIISRVYDVIHCQVFGVPYPSILYFERIACQYCSTIIGRKVDPGYNTPIEGELPW